MKKYVIVDDQYECRDRFCELRNATSTYSLGATQPALRAGRWVYELVGKLELSEGKPKPFEVGKTYKTTVGFSVRIVSTRLYDRDMLGMVDRGDFESYAYFTPAGRRTGGVATDVGDLIPEKSSGEVILQPSDDGE